MKKFLTKWLARRGYRLSKLTPDEKVTRLIESLRARKPSSHLKRFGGDTDGGYLVPDDLVGISAVVSPGVGRIANFEADIVDAIGPECSVFMADASVDPPMNLRSNWYFNRSYVAGIDRSPNIRLETWVDSCIGGGTSDLLLQMDIEGSEYSVFIDTPTRILQRFRIIVVEFHRLDLLISAEMFEFYALVFKKLLDTHVVVHIHPNNNDGILLARGVKIPRTMEFTFLRKDRFIPGDGRASYPNPLDRKNNPNKPDLVLPEIWI